MLALETIYFIFIVFLIFYLPGKFYLRLFGYNFADPFTSVSSSLISGISAYLLSVYLLSFIHLDFIYNLVLLPVIFLELRNILKSEKNFRQTKNYLPEISVVIIGSLAMTSLTAFSGLLTKEGGMIFYGLNARDGIYHLSLAGNMLNNFPPTHPELAGIPLRGYHFFYDFMIANINKFYHVSLINSVFRYFPFFMALLYGLTSIALAKALKMNRFTTLVFTFLLYFAAGVEMFIFTFISKGQNYGTGINPLLVNIINPSVLLSIASLFCGYTLLFGKNKNILIPALIFGILPEIKIYTGILALGALFILGLYNLAKNRDTYIIKVFALASVLAAIVFLPFNLGAGGLIFAPFLLYRHFMETFSATWGLQFQTFEQYKNIPRVGLLYLKGLILFFIPTLGIRLLSLALLIKLKRKNLLTQVNVFWGSLIILGILFASVFIQNTDVFNIVQFLWIVYIILLIPTAFATSLIVGNSDLRKILLVTFIVLICIPPAFSLIKSTYKDPYIIQKNEVLASNYVKNNISRNEGLVVINGTPSGNYSLPEIAALSSHSVFFEPTITSFANTESTKLKRSQMVSQINSSLTSCVGDVNNDLVNIMKNTHNKYILTFERYPCMASLPNIKKLKDFDKISIYEAK